MTFQKTMPPSLCPGMGDLPAPGKKKEKAKQSMVVPLYLSQNYRHGVSCSLPGKPPQHRLACDMYPKQLRNVRPGFTVAALTSQALLTRQGVNASACPGSLAGRYGTWLACFDAPNRTSAFYLMLEHYVLPPCLPQPCG